MSRQTNTAAGNKMTRRSVIGASGTLALALVGGTLVLREQRRSESADAQRQPLLPESGLSVEAQHLYAAITLAIFERQLESEHAKRDSAILEVLEHIDSAAQRLPLYLQEEAEKLAELLSYGIGRYLATGHWSAADEMSPEQCRGMLETMQHSGITLHRKAFLALRDTVVSAWYARRSSWPQLAYPGPVVDFRRELQGR